MKGQERTSVTRRAFMAGSAAAVAVGCARPPVTQRVTGQDGVPRPIPPERAPNVTVSRVELPSQGVTLVGDLYLPTGTDARPVPAAFLLGPFGYVREQGPSYHAMRLAARGVAALVFDCRGHGESHGAPRRYENPTIKVADARAALDFLSTRSEIEARKVFAVGLCQGASPMMKLAAEDARIAGLVTVAGAFLTGGTWRVERGLEARQKFERTGEVDYLPIIDPHRKDVGLPSPYIWSWYRKWVGTSRWENRYAVMSDAEVWSFDVSAAAKRVSTPFLMVHSEEAHDPEDARAVFSTIGSRDKQQFFLEGAPDHVKFYDHPATVDRASARVAEFIKEHS